MASLKANTTKSALLRKGFSLRQGDHHYLEFVHKGKIVARTMMSHNQQDIGDSLISKMYKGCRVSKMQFLALVDCSLSQEQYIEALKQQGLL